MNKKKLYRGRPWSCRLFCWAKMMRNSPSEIYRLQYTAEVSRGSEGRSPYWRRFHRFAPPTSTDLIKFIKCYVFLCKRKCGSIQHFITVTVSTNLHESNAVSSSPAVFATSRFWAFLPSTDRIDWTYRWTTWNKRNPLMYKLIIIIVTNNLNAIKNSKSVKPLRVQNFFQNREYFLSHKTNNE